MESICSLQMLLTRIFLMVGSVCICSMCWSLVCICAKLPFTNNLLANPLFLEFVHYWPLSQSINIHYLHHMGDFVRNHGPLWLEFVLLFFLYAHLYPNTWPATSWSAGKHDLRHYFFRSITFYEAFWCCRDLESWSPSWYSKDYSACITWLWIPWCREAFPSKRWWKATYTLYVAAVSCFKNYFIQFYNIVSIGWM